MHTSFYWLSYDILALTTDLLSQPSELLTIYKWIHSHETPCSAVTLATDRLSHLVTLMQSVTRKENFEAASDIVMCRTAGI